LAAADRALALDPSLPEPHAAKARVLANRGDFTGAMIEVKEALRLDPNSYDANMVAGVVSDQALQFNDAIPYFKKCVEILESNFVPFGMLVGIYMSIGDHDLARQYAELTLARTQPVLMHEPDNGIAMGYAAMALGVLGHSDRAREIVSRGLLLDPDNEIMKFFFFQAYVVLRDADSALSLLEELSRGTFLVRILAALKMNPKFAFIRDDPRAAAVFAAAEARLGGSN
jgi:adenylate cyclase